jgi:hypothetical protein
VLYVFVVVVAAEKAVAAEPSPKSQLYWGDAAFVAGAANVMLVFTCLGGPESVPIVIDSTMVHVKAMFVGGLIPSVTVTVVLNNPAVVGVPEIVPLVGWIDKPGGRPVAEYVSDCVPAVSAKI